MFGEIIRKTKRALAVMRFGLLVLRWCGPRIFISSTLHQLYGQTIFLVTKGQAERPQDPSDFQCIVSLASPDDIKELFSGLNTESPEGRYQLLVRQWYHERGFSDCYIARATDNNEICHVRWFVTAKHIKQMGWEDRYPLEEDEIMSENMYTFERFRDKGVRRAAAKQTREIRRQLGYQRRRGYIDENNIQQRKRGERRGTLVQAKVLERHFLFRVTRKTLEQYDPPIPMTAPPDIQ